MIMRINQLVLCLGIDFGTKYTKVCFRDLARRKSKVVAFTEATPSLNDAIIPSILYKDESGRYHAGMSLAMSTATSVSWVSKLEYIKMRLADLDLGYSQRIDVYAPVDDATDQTLATEAVCAFFLCHVIRNAKESILDSEKKLVEGREVIWTANIGVPVEYYDSPSVGRFRRVFAAAWVMANDYDLIGATCNIRDMMFAYRAVADTDPESQNCSAIPEIGAAVQSFLTSRAAQDGVYIYFDVGAGTLDGVSFRYYRYDGEPKIFFYSGKVKPLGINALAVRIREISSSAVSLSCFEEELFHGNISLKQPKLDQLRDEIQKQVAQVIMSGQRLDPNGFSAVSVRKLPVFIGGGGAFSECYKEAILSTHIEFQHGNVGIPPYSIINVPKPQDLDLAGLDNNDYQRFCIAYGLTPEGELADFHLPSEMSKEARETQENRGARRTCKYCSCPPIPGDNVCASCA